MTARQLDLPPRASSRTSCPAPAADAVEARRAPFVLLYLDVVVLVVATLPALVLGAPALGYLVGAGGWLFQRALAEFDRRWIGSTSAPGSQLGRSLFEGFGRIWLLAGAIVIAGVVGGRADGLTAAVTIFVAYSIAFALRLNRGRPEGVVGR
jgi:hypothetical protein